jgi:hypothetical protein
VTVTVGRECTTFEDTSGKVTTCSDSHWTIDGQTHRGDAHFEGVPSVLGAGRPRTVEAYALPGDDEAYTEGYAALGFEGLHVFYAVPAWLALAAPLLVVALIVRAVIRRIRRGASPPAG